MKKTKNLLSNVFFGRHPVKKTALKNALFLHASLETVEKIVTKRRLFSYSVIQSDENSFRDFVVLGGFNMAYRDEDNISDKIFIK